MMGLRGWIVNVVCGTCLSHLGKIYLRNSGICCQEEIYLFNDHKITPDTICLFSSGVQCKRWDIYVTMILRVSKCPKVVSQKLAYIK